MRGRCEQGCVPRQELSWGTGWKREASRIEIIEPSRYRRSGGWLLTKTGFFFSRAGPMYPPAIAVGMKHCPNLNVRKFGVVTVWQAEVGSRREGGGELDVGGRRTQRCSILPSFPTSVASLRVPAGYYTHIRVDLRVIETGSPSQSVTVVSLRADSEFVGYGADRWKMWGQ